MLQWWLGTPVSLLELCNKNSSCAKFCPCWRSNVEFKTHLNSFAICTFLSQVRCLLPGGANVVRCAALSSGGLAFYLERPYSMDEFFWRAFRITQVCGGDCRWWWFSLPLSPNERRGLLLLQLAFASTGDLPMEDDASSGIFHSSMSSLLYKSQKGKNIYIHIYVCIYCSEIIYRGCWYFSLSRYTMQDSLLQLQFRHNPGQLLFKVEI